MFRKRCVLWINHKLYCARYKKPVFPIRQHCPDQISTARKFNQPSKDVRPSIQLSISIKRLDWKAARDMVHNYWIYVGGPYDIHWSGIELQVSEEAKRREKKTSTWSKGERNRANCQLVLHRSNVLLAIWHSILLVFIQWNNPNRTFEWLVAQYLNGNDPNGPVVPRLELLFRRSHSLHLHCPSRKIKPMGLWKYRKNLQDS